MGAQGGPIGLMVMMPVVEILIEVQRSGALSVGHLRPTNLLGNLWIEMSIQQDLMQEHFTLKKYPQHQVQVVLCTLAHVQLYLSCDSRLVYMMVLEMVCDHAVICNGISQQRERQPLS